ncbi:MAG TPA: PrsW family intramembrane metalloprotease [Anaerolineae bacterium]|jgi:RsiW-degrading membrane proteinase PrsW (M82 family)|nr:PrsW family intramembrane metalloprotease [Anaerolineae bacterium]
MQPVWYVVLAVLTILASVAPAVVYSLVIWWLDRYEKEPWGLLMATFIWGAAPAIILSLMAEFILGIPFYTLLDQAAAQLISGSLVAPVVEEVFKGMAIVLVFLLFRHEFDGILDGIVYGALVGFGFAMAENGLYFLGALLEDGAAVWLTVIFLRTLVFGLNHGLFSGIVGMGLGYAAVTRSAFWRWLAPPLALGAAIVVHAVHNLSTSLAGEMGWPILIGLLNDWGGVLVLIVVVMLAWDRERGWIVQELESEVAAGRISGDEYATAASYSRRVSAQWRALRRHGPGGARLVRRFYQLTTELAFAKRRLRNDAPDAVAERVISHLSSEIVALREQLTDG